MGNPRDHFWLTIGMSRACGVDLSDAMRDQKLSKMDYAGMITACRKCAQPSACQALLDQTEPGQILTAAPEYCVNRSTFEMLAC
jgi:hypothetical protein